MSEKIETKTLSRSKNAQGVFIATELEKQPAGVPSVRVLQGNPGRGMPYRIDLFGGNGPVRKLSSMGAEERLAAFRKMFGNGPVTKTFENDCQCGNDPNADKAAAFMAMSVIEGTRNGYVRFGRNAVNVDPSRKGYSIGSIQVCEAGGRGNLTDAARERSLRKYDTCVQAGLGALRLLGCSSSVADLVPAQMDMVAKIGHDLPRFVNRTYGQVARRAVRRKDVNGKSRIVGYRAVRLPYQGAYKAEHVRAYLRDLEAKLGGKRTAQEISKMHGSIAQTGRSVAASIKGGKMDLEIV